MSAETKPSSLIAPSAVSDKTQQGAAVMHDQHMPFVCADFTGRQLWLCLNSACVQVPPVRSTPWICLQPRKHQTCKHLALPPAAPLPAAALATPPPTALALALSVAMPLPALARVHCV